MYRVLPGSSEWCESIWTFYTRIHHSRFKQELIHHARCRTVLLSQWKNQVLKISGLLVCSFRGLVTAFTSCDLISAESDLKRVHLFQQLPSCFLSPSVRDAIIARNRKKEYLRVKKPRRQYCIGWLGRCLF